MKWTQLESGSVYAAGHQLLTALGDSADTVIARVNSDSGFVGRLARIAICDVCAAMTDSQKRARQIMRRNFFGVEEAVRYFNLYPTSQQLTVFSAIPFSEEILKQYRATHILVAVFPLSIIEIRDRVGYKLFFYQPWQNKAFTKEPGKMSWQLVRRTPVPDSISKNWGEQQSLVGKDEEVPSSQVMVYTIVGHLLATGERLFKRICVRTSSVYSDDRHVIVGDFASERLSIEDADDYCPEGTLGVSSARKLD